MAGITQAQIRKIYALARERGIDNEDLHAHVFRMTKKDSVSKLSVREAIKVIDSLCGKISSTPGMMTAKQRWLIEQLAKEIGWVDDCGEADNKRLAAFIRERYHVDRAEWITVQTAAKVIEGLKKIKERTEAESAV